MQVTPEFLNAKKSNSVRAFTVSFNESTGTNINLFLEEKSKFSEQRMDVHIRTETTIRYANYKQGFNKESIKKVSFHESVYENSHIRTFLDAIKKDSDVSFEAVLFNQSENLDSVGFVCHVLYGYIGNKKYLLSQYVGPNNFASPVNY